MPGKTAEECLALDQQNKAIMALFERAGFNHIIPDIIQPADIFLERSGESIRAQTFLFIDPAGKEQCLRPDITVPTCRFHLSHEKNLSQEARYCYVGKVFRFFAESEIERESTQAGLEWFAAPNPLKAEAQILKYTLQALEAAGLTDYRVTLGDLGLFAALLEDSPMPERWRLQLQHGFWRPSLFWKMLETMSKPAEVPRTSISPLIDQLEDPLEQRSALDLVNATLEQQGLALTGGRSPEEIAARLAHKAANRTEPRLSPLLTQQIEAYLAVNKQADQLQPLLAKLLSGPKGQKAASLYQERLAAMAELGLDPATFQFQATFGRDLEYYTGFVFQIEARKPRSTAPECYVPVAGGGRYDKLLQDMGANQPVPALGSAIFTDTLRALKT